MPSPKLVHAALFTHFEGRWGLPLLLWADPGTGKTSSARSAARSAGLFFYRLSASERGEGQFGVVPVPGTDGFLHYPAPDWVTMLADGGVLLVDEISTLEGRLQAPLLGLVQFAVLGSHTFGPRVRIIGATNEPKDAAGGWDLSLALGNRFAHLQYEGLPAEDWSTGLLSHFGAHDGPAVDARVEEARVLAALPAADAWARGLVAGFIRRNTGRLHKKPEAHAGVRAWPSRRTWEYAAVALASARIHGLSEIETDELAGAYVGAENIGELRTWEGNSDLPDPAELLDGRVRYEHDPRRPDRTYVVLGSCASLVVPPAATPAAAEERKARALRLFQLMIDIMKQDSIDLLVPTAEALARAKGIATLGKDADEFYRQIQPVLERAGIRFVG